MSDPLHQFEIYVLFPLKMGSLDISFTNASLFMVIAVFAATFFLWGGITRSTIVPGRWQAMTEMVYDFISNMVDETIG
jgi:F-type H+-transporting ATPase subunit a